MDMLRDYYTVEKQVSNLDDDPESEMESKYTGKFKNSMIEEDPNIESFPTFQYVGDSQSQKKK